MVTNKKQLPSKTNLYIVYDRETCAGSEIRATSHVQAANIYTKDNEPDLNTEIFVFDLASGISFGIEPIAVRNM